MTAKMAKAIRNRAGAVTIFLCASGKSFGLFELPRVDAAGRRQNIEIKGLVGKILRNKELET